MLGRESNIGLDVWLFGAYLPSGRTLIIIPLDRPIWECVMRLRRSGESCGKMESVWGEFGAIGPAFGQRTNEDEEDYIIYQFN